MAIRTGKGDNGLTGVSGRSRTSKDSAIIHVLGDLDELSSFLGLVRCKVKSASDKKILKRLQLSVFGISSEIALGKKNKRDPLLGEEDVNWINSVINKKDKKLKLESGFYLSGENELSAYLDLARAIARRAERYAVAFFCDVKIKNRVSLTYLNCISDLLFLMARDKANGKGKIGDRF